MKQSEDLEIIKLWKKNKIDRVEMDFTCGGDSMGDMDWSCFDQKDKIDNKDTSEITNYLDNIIFDNVEFYEVSDGNYLGESGTVTITLEDDEFVFSKSSVSDFNEQFSDIMDVVLSDRELELLKEYVININGGEGEVIINYKKDGILSEEDDEILDLLKERIAGDALDFDIETADGEWDDSCSFSTSIDEDDEPNLTFEDNKLMVRVTKNFNITREN